MKKLTALITLATLTIAPAVLAGSGCEPDCSIELPEPATWALFGAATVAILVMKKFKK